MIRHHSRSWGGVLLGVAMAGLICASPATAKSNKVRDCLAQWYHGEARHELVQKARVGAVEDWIGKVTQQEGAHWATPDRTVQPKCEKAQHQGRPEWTCTYSLRPCRWLPVAPEATPMVPLPAPGSGVAVRP
jgi:hypothetical protein